VNNEFEGMWKEPGVNYFKVLLQNLLEGDGKKPQKFQSRYSTSQSKPKSGTFRMSEALAA
jgi:hypothetical protein